MRTTAIDLSPITDVLLQLAGTVLLAAGTWATGRLVQWLGLKNAAQTTANLDDALQKSVTYGLQQSQALIRQKGWDHAEVRSQALGQALPYMISHFPGALHAAGLDAADQAVTARKVMGALDRSFPHAASVSAASPATPPATAPVPQTTAGLAGQPGATTSLVEAALA